MYDVGPFKQRRLSLGVAACVKGKILVNIDKYLQPGKAKKEMIHRLGREWNDGDTLMMKEIACP